MICNVIQSSGHPGPVAEEAGGFDKLREFCRRAAADLRVPGVAVSVRCGASDVAFGEGVTNLAAPAAVTERTAFPVASLTKIVTATATMRLVETGQLALDEPVRRWLPDLDLPDQEVAGQVTIRDLLTHRTGWDGDLYEDHGRGDDALRQVVQRIRELEILAPFRRFVSYNNSNFYILGRLLELVCGGSYEEIARELVLRPLEMNDSAFFLDELVHNGIAAGHVTTFEPTRPGFPFMSNRSWNPTGGLLSTSRDMLRLASAHVDGSLLAPDTLAKMREPQAPALSTAQSVGLAWWCDQVDGCCTFAHVGDVFITQSLLFLVPERDFALFATSNSNVGFALNRRIRDWCLERLLGLEVREPEPSTPDVDNAGYVGSYNSRGNAYRVEIRGSALWVTHWSNPGVWPEFQPDLPTLPPFELRPCGEDRFVVPSGPIQGNNVVFCRDDAGRVGWIHCFGRLARKIDDAV